MSRKFRFGKFGLREDPTGAHVTLDWQGRTLLGEVRSAEYNQATGYIVLTVRHFNGELWPIQPTVLAVNVLSSREEA